MQYLWQSDKPHAQKANECLQLLGDSVLLPLEAIFSVGLVHFFSGVNMARSLNRVPPVSGGKNNRRKVNKPRLMHPVWKMRGQLSGWFEVMFPEYLCQLIVSCGTKYQVIQQY